MSSSGPDGSPVGLQPGWMPAVVLAVVALAVVVLSASPLVFAHGRGLYDNKADAERRAQELGCIGVHQNKDKWMPCRDEQQLHHHLRHQ